MRKKTPSINCGWNILNFTRAHEKRSKSDKLSQVPHSVSVLFLTFSFFRSHITYPTAHSEQKKIFQPDFYGRFYGSSVLQISIHTIRFLFTLIFIACQALSFAPTPHTDAYLLLVASNRVIYLDFASEVHPPNDSHGNEHWLGTSCYDRTNASSTKHMLHMKGVFYIGKLYDSSKKFKSIKWIYNSSGLTFARLVACFFSH